MVPVLITLCFAARVADAGATALRPRTVDDGVDVGALRLATAERVAVCDTVLFDVALRPVAVRALDTDAELRAVGTAPYALNPLKIIAEISNIFFKVPPLLSFQFYHKNIQYKREKI